MSKKLYSEESIQDIADAIREKNGSSETYKVGDMAGAISLLGEGGGDSYTIVNAGSATGTSGVSSSYSSDPHLNLVKNGSTVVSSIKLTARESGSSTSGSIYATNGEFQFNFPVPSIDNKAATLSYGKTSTIATINGTDITVNMPSASGSGSSGGGNTYSYEHTGSTSGNTATFTLSSESSPSDCWVLLSGEVYTSDNTNENKFISVIMDLGDLSRPFLTGYNNSYITASLSGNILTCVLSSGSWTNVRIKTIY